MGTSIYMPLVYDLICVYEYVCRDINGNTHGRKGSRGPVAALLQRASTRRHNKSIYLSSYHLILVAFLFSVLTC